MNSPTPAVSFATAHDEGGATSFYTRIRATPVGSPTPLAWVAMLERVPTNKPLRSLTWDEEQRKHHHGGLSQPGGSPITYAGTPRASLDAHALPTTHHRSC